MTDPAAGLPEQLTDLEYVRFLIDDEHTDAADNLLDDRTITSLIAREGNPMLAAAAALDRIATSVVLLERKITTQDLSTDGAAVAAELRAQAAALRRRHADELAAMDDDFAFQVVTYPVPSAAPELTEHGRDWPW